MSAIPIVYYVATMSKDTDLRLLLVTMFSYGPLMLCCLLITVLMISICERFVLFSLVCVLLRFATMEMQFRNHMRNLFLCEGNLQPSLLVSSKTYNTQLCHVLIRNIAGSTDEQHGIIKEMQDVVEAESS